MVINSQPLVVVVIFFARRGQHMTRGGRGIFPVRFDVFMMLRDAIEVRNELCPHFRGFLVHALVDPCFYR